MKYRSKPVIVEAVQWNKPGDHPAVCAVEHFNTSARPAAWEIEGYSVRGKQGWSCVNPGDWIITEPDGSGHYPCADSVFRAKYEPVED